MSIEAKVIGNYDPKNVQIEIKTPKSTHTKFYKVPTERADSFITSYKNNDKNVNIVANASFIGSAIAGVMLTSIGTNKLKNKAAKWILNIVGGILGAGASIYGSSNYIEKKHNQILKTHNAQEIIYK